MLTRTLTLSALSTLVLLTTASPLPGGDRDGDRIKFKEIKKVNDDKFKKTNFNTHEAKVKDKNFNNVEKKDRDVGKAIKFRKEDDDDKHDFYKRQFDLEASTDVDVDSSFDDEDFGDFDGEDEGFGRSVSFDFDLDTDILSRFDTGRFEDFDFGGHYLVKRGDDYDDDDGERIKFKEIKKVNDDKFKKTNFNVHDKTVHDKNFNQVENKDRDVLKAVKFRKEEEHRRYRGGKHDRYYDDDKHDRYYA